MHERERARGRPKVGVGGDTPVAWFVDAMATELAKLNGLSDKERRIVEAATSQILNKLLHLPTVRMKEAAAAAEGDTYADAVRHLFGLEEER